MLNRRSHQPPNASSTPYLWNQMKPQTRFPDNNQLPNSNIRLLLILFGLNFWLKLHEIMRTSNTIMFLPLNATVASRVPFQSSNTGSALRTNVARPPSHSLGFPSNPIIRSPSIWHFLFLNLNSVHAVAATSTINALVWINSKNTATRTSK